MRDIYSYKIGKVMYLYIKKLLSLQFSCLFTNLLTIYDKFTRSNLYVPKFSTQRRQRSIKFQGAKILNSFAQELRSQKYGKFKTMLKKQLLAEYHKK